MPIVLEVLNWPIYHLEFFVKLEKQNLKMVIFFFHSQIDYAKTNIDSANQAIRTRVETTQTTLWTTWNDWTTEEAQGENVGDVNVDEKVHPFITL